MARICVIRQYLFPRDVRVRREVEALTAAGHDVDVICARGRGELRHERVGRVTVHRLPVGVRRGTAVRYAFQYGAFLLAAGLFAGALHLRRRWHLVQVNTLPDALVFAAAIPRLLGARVVLDLHECMPEFFATKFRVRLDHPAVRLIGLIEQASIRFADHAITCTAQMRDAFVRRGAPEGRIEVVLNAADETLFDPSRYPPSSRDPARFTLICPGALEEHYGVDTLVRAAALIHGRIPGLRIEIYGEGSYRAALEALTRELGMREVVTFHGFVADEDLLRAIAAADAGVVAVKRDAFRDLTHCNKMFELITMRRPAIVSRTRAVEACFDESCFVFFESDDARDLARAICRLHADPALGERLVARATEANEPYRWPRQREVYLSTVERLLAARARRALGGEWSVAS
jgi:glycosyltransferase involved in cell wall biosynthesis